MLWGFESVDGDPEHSFVFFDEVQYVENWEQQLKVLVDRYSHVKFVVTGSATAALHKKSKESGAGRFTEYMLPPLSFYEFMAMRGAIEKTQIDSIDLEKLNELYVEYLNYGGFPESFTSQSIRDFPEQYIGQDILDKVLMRDLPSVFGINNPTELNRLFTALAYNSSNEISLESISKTSGVSKKDIYKYIEYMEAAFLLKTVDKTDDKIQQFKRRTFFKVILANPSLRSAIFGKIQKNDPELEGLAETAVFSQLVIHTWHVSRYKYARWNRGNSKGEVDLVYVDKKGAPVAALEIKWTDRFALQEEVPKSLLTFCRENGLPEGYMTSRNVFSETTHGDIKIYHIPTAFLCLMIGFQVSINTITEKIVIHTAEQIKKDGKFSSLDPQHISAMQKIMTDLYALKADLLKQHFSTAFKVANVLVS